MHDRNHTQRESTRTDWTSLQAFRSDAAATRAFATASLCCAAARSLSAVASVALRRASSNAFASSSSIAPGCVRSALPTASEDVGGGCGGVHDWLASLLQSKPPASRTYSRRTKAQKG